MTDNRPIFAPRSKKQLLVLSDDKTDILLTGGGAGSSKTYTCLLKALKYIQDPAARVMIIRESYPTLKLSGGLVDESKSIYPHFGGILGIQALVWRFPNGATIQFAALPDDLREWQGLQASHILVDEAAGFKESEILFLLSRLRSAKYKGHMNLTMTCNPDTNSFLYSWVEYCLDQETGIPRPGTEDITRWFVQIGGKMQWGNSPEELYSVHGTGMEMGKNFIPISFRFIPMNLHDNPVLLANNPTYLTNLLAQPRVNQQRYLHGSWTARPEGSSFFDRSWVTFVEFPSTQATARVRSWDIAHSKPSEALPDPDYTVGVLISKDKFGIYTIEDVVRIRGLADTVMKTIIDTAKNDGPDVKVTIPRDTGAGKTLNTYQVRILAEAGVPVKSIVMSGHTNKHQRFLPFASLAEGRSVRIVRGPWNDDYLTELEFFTGFRKGVHDDQVDATSDSFNTLCKEIQLPTFVIPSMTQPSPIPTI